MARKISVACVIPVFTVGDVKKVAHWYRDKLGWKVQWFWGEKGGKPGYGCVAFGKFDLHLSAKPAAMRDKGSAVYFMTGVDAYAAQLKKRRVKLNEEPADRPYGIRDFSLNDPAGNRLTFGEVIGR